ncbi:MAG: hypothetical protein WA888_16340, partial [Burkholderiaceae bacterium]
MDYFAGWTINHVRPLAQRRHECFALVHPDESAAQFLKRFLGNLKRSTHHRTNRRLATTNDSTTALVPSQLPASSCAFQLQVYDPMLFEELWNDFGWHRAGNQVA